MSTRRTHRAASALAVTAVAVTAVAVTAVAVALTTGPARAGEPAPPADPAAPVVDATVRATAKGCDLPPERVAATQHPTLRALPGAATKHYDADPDGRGEEWLLQTAALWMRLTDTSGDGKPDRRTRELYAGDDRDRLECTIDDVWQGGRWRVVTTARFEGDLQVTTTFRGGRPVKVDRRPAIIE